MTQLKDKFHLPEYEDLIGLNVMYDTDELSIYFDGNLPAGEYKSANDVIGEYGVKAIYYHYREGGKHLYINIKKDGALSIHNILYIINRVIISEELEIDTASLGELI